MIDQSKYTDLFLSEAREHLDTIDTALLKFEKNTQDKKAAEELMRHAHTLKGMASEMGYGELSNLTHSFEGMVENIKNGIAPKGGVDLLFGVIDELRTHIEKVVLGGPTRPANPLVEKVGELEEIDTQQEQQIAEQPELFRKILEVKVGTKQLDAMINLAAELMVNKMRLEDAGSREGVKTKKGILTNALEEHARLIEQLQYQVLQLRLTPLSKVFNRFPRMVRDLAKKQNKTVDFVLTGGDIEIDRSILDILGEPILHLLRNAIDHGIEKKRVITLSAEREQDSVVIKVHDDGKRIDWNALKRKRKEAKSNALLEDFLFSGISTAEDITEVSGRGVGLSVVKRKVEDIGGSLEVDSKQEKRGTTFILQFPLSVAIIKALIVTVRNQMFAVPVTFVDRLVQMKHIIHEKQADQNITVIDEKEVPLIRLEEVFGLTSDTLNDTEDEDQEALSRIAFLTTNKRKRVALVIDAVLSQQDIIVKPFTTKMIQGKGYFSAVTILGDGKPVPIIDIDSILSMATTTK